MTRSVRGRDAGRTSKHRNARRHASIEVAMFSRQLDLRRHTGGADRRRSTSPSARSAEARIAHMAHHDALTGLPNRVLFRRAWTESSLAAARRRQPSRRCASTSTTSSWSTTRSAIRSAIVLLQNVAGASARVAAPRRHWPRASAATSSPCWWPAMKAPQEVGVLAAALHRRRSASRYVIDGQHGPDRRQHRHRRRARRRRRSPTTC